MKKSQASQTVSRRAALAGLGAGGIGVAFAASLGSAAAQDATPYPMAGHPAIGAWIVDRNPDEPSFSPVINIYTADGGISDPIGGVGGAWLPTGPRTAIFTLLGLINDGPPGYIVIRGTNEYDAAGMISTAPYVVDIVGPDGKVVATMRAKNRATRLTVASEAEGGTPLEGVRPWIPATPTDATPVS